MRLSGKRCGIEVTSLSNLKPSAMIVMATLMKFSVRLTGVGKRYGTQWVLSRLTLNVRQGESVALFGGNGSGKSTLLKIIATLLTPSTGELNVLGFDAAKQKGEIRSRIRLLGHDKQLYGSLTVLENLKLAAGL